MEEGKWIAQLVYDINADYERMSQRSSYASPIENQPFGVMNLAGEDDSTTEVIKKN